MKKDPNFLSVKDAAAFLGVTRYKLVAWEKIGKIVSYRNYVNAYRLYKKEDLENLLNNPEINE